MLLEHCNPTLLTIVAADTSSCGVDAFTLPSLKNRKGKATVHTSLTITPIAKKYSQIGKEILASVFAFRCFHKFSYGWKFTI